MQQDYEDISDIEFDDNEIVSRIILEQVLMERRMAADCSAGPGKKRRAWDDDDDMDDDYDDDYDDDDDDDDDFDDDDFDDYSDDRY